MKAKTDIYFVRHGNVYNPGKIWYGRLPRMRLSNEGIGRTLQVARYFKNKQIDEIYASPLLRARQTAKVLSKSIGFMNPIKISNKLFDIKSHLQGRPFSYIKAIGGDFFSSENRIDTDETMKQILDRMLTFCHSIHIKLGNKKIIAVSHGDPLMILKAHIEGKPMCVESIRPGPEKYIQYGEIYWAAMENRAIKSLKSIRFL